MASRKGCLCCLRGLLLTSSIIFLIIGDIIAGAGIYFTMFDSQRAVAEFKAAFPKEFFAFKLALILCGSFIVLVAFCACVGIVLRSKCALILYSVLTGILVVSFSAGSIVLVAVPSLGSNTRAQTELRLKSSYGNTSLITFSLDTLHTKLECCGWHTSALTAYNSCDWFSNTAWKLVNRHPDEACPPSCCHREHRSACTKDKVHSKGCFTALSKYMIAAPLVLVGGVVLSLCHLLCVLILIFKQNWSREMVSSI